MNILIVSQHFYPESFIINQIATELQNKGHQVTVYTGKPNYPEGQFFKGYRGWGVQHEEYAKGIKIIRSPMLARGRGGALGLVLNYLSFCLISSFLAPFLFRNQKFDIIFNFSTSPIFSALPAVVLRLLKKGRALGIWVLDLWPQSLAATGYIKNPLALSLVDVFVKFVYKKCDFILAQSPAFIPEIQSRVIKDKAIYYYPNSYKNPQAQKESEKEAGPLSEAITKVFAQNFCVVMAGNVGKAQSVPTIVEAAKILKAHSEIRLVIVGSGSHLSWLKKQAEEFNLSNIISIGRVAPEQMPQILSGSKAMLLTLDDELILSYTLPWRTQAYLAHKKPVIGAINGEGARIIQESACGLVGPSKDANMLAQNILKMYQLTEDERQQMGQKGYQYYLKHFEMDQKIKDLEEIFFQQAGSSE